MLLIMNYLCPLFYPLLNFRVLRQLSDIGFSPDSGFSPRDLSPLQQGALENAYRAANVTIFTEFATLTSLGRGDGQNRNGWICDRGLGQ